MKKRVAFVINPKSGSDRKTDRVSFVKENLADSYDAEIFLWAEVSQRDEIFQNILQGKFDIAVAVGGDGTVSQLAAALSGSDIALAIVPFGSGNGLARHLGVPMNRIQAMKLISDGEAQTIDYGTINGHKFFCTAGSGFDARIGKLFAESSERGFWTYAKLTLSEFRKYRGEKYQIEADGKKIEREAFLVTVANAGQYGNDAWIAPQANVKDGLLHVVILRPFRWWNIAGIAMKMFRKTIHKSRFTETLTVKNVTLRRAADGAAHFDGEPAEMNAELRIEIIPSGLKVIVPRGFKG